MILAVAGFEGAPALDNSSTKTIRQLGGVE
jgi:hypothetical protein